MAFEFKVPNDDRLRKAVEEYTKANIINTLNNVPKYYMPVEFIKIKNVIFNDPATIVFWHDGTKTVVKAQDSDIFDPEKGLAMAISKKALGNKGNYCNELKKWLPKEEETWQPTLSEAAAKVFGVREKKLCSTCEYGHVLSVNCIFCKGRGYVNWTPKDDTEAK